MTSDEIADRERIAAEAQAALDTALAEYRHAEGVLTSAADRLADAKQRAERACGRVHLARLRAMLGG